MTKPDELEFNQELEIIYSGVAEVLGQDSSGHDMPHVDRVVKMTREFCEELGDKVDARVAILAALLHDVDDYKVVGTDQSRQYANLTSIMNRAEIDEITQEKIRNIVSSMGYSKSLRGVRPETIEGHVVSDADMCDAMGASGTIRCLQYTLGGRGSKVIFDKTSWPETELTADQYMLAGTERSTDSFVNHHFDKLLKLKNMMLTEPGKKEASKRHDVMANFLRAYFEEQDAPEWVEYLDKFNNQT